MKINKILISILLLSVLILSACSTPAPQQTCRDVQVEYQEQEPYTDYETRTVSSSEDMTVSSGSSSSQNVYTIPINLQKDGKLYIQASSSTSSALYAFGEGTKGCKMDGLRILTTAGSGTSYSTSYLNAKAGTSYCLVISQSCDENDLTACLNNFQETHNVRLEYTDYDTVREPVTKYRTVTKYKTETRCS